MTTEIFAHLTRDHVRVPQFMDKTDMLVRFLGFNFSTDAANMSIDDYVKYMTTKVNQDYELGEHKRFIFFNTTHSQDYYVGLLVTVKDQKTFCELVSKDKKLMVKVSELDEDSSLMDFNFFVINKLNGIGLYQHYHQSCSVNSFGYFNNRRFSEYRKEAIDSEIAQIPEDKISEAKKKKVREKYKGSLSWEVLVRKEKLSELIQQLKRVKAFEYSFGTLTVQEEEFNPLKGFVKKETTTLSFTSQSPVQVLADAITKIVATNDIEDGKVIGIDAEGIDRVLRLTDNPDNFGEYDYDELAPKINSLDIDQFEQSWVIKELLAKCNEYKHIFEAKVK